MKILDYKKYAKTARDMIGEGCVLLKNDKKTLPIGEGEVVSVFGREQKDSYYCGTGSGGMVNPPYVVNILDGIKKQRKINQNLADIYEEWISQNPFDMGSGWAQEPWCQVEMPLSKEVVQNAKSQSDIAIFVIGRSAGEDKDSADVQGSYYLSEVEEANIKLICETFEKVVVMLNCGNLMDMSWVAKYNPSAVMYAWHGGSESGNGYADVLCGAVNPSGKLTGTVAVALEKNPSTKNFGDLCENVYQEDIFLGYRYFETFAKEDVLYPFGFGLSFTTFEISDCVLNEEKGKYHFIVSVKNTGDVAGKETVQAYVQAPQGVLGKPSRVLVGFAKTPTIKSGETLQVQIDIKDSDYASYDESGATGFKSCFVLEEGEYQYYIGTDVRNAKCVHKFNLNHTVVVERCSRALAPTRDFKKMTAVFRDGELTFEMQDAYAFCDNLKQRIKEERKDVPQAKNNGFTFADLQAGKVSLEDFACQLTDAQLIHIARGEGMCSPKVTSGTAGCFGGVTEELAKMGIPIACCADGPSGIRMDSGTMAFSMPNGTLIASAFNGELTEELFDHLGKEMLKNKIDTILGPGVNIHRNPLCGRNFEYFSEDPYLAGRMCVAELAGLHKHGVTATLKHFACNSQENSRRHVNAVLSERALREIYLKAFQTAVVEGGAISIMTAYNPINGYHSASNFDLTTTILRGEWGYDGVVMTDWWAGTNFELGEYSEQNIGAMILCQNDLYMVNGNAFENSNEDNADVCMQDGRISRYELLRNGKNIISFLQRMNCASGYSYLSDFKVENQPDGNSRTIKDMGTQIIQGKTKINLDGFTTERGTSSQYILHVEEKGAYTTTMHLSCIAKDTAQVSMSISANGIHVKTITLKGGTQSVEKLTFEVFTNINTYLEFYFKESGMVVESIEVERN